MIQQLVGDLVSIHANQEGVQVRTSADSLHLSDAEWRELAYLLDIVEQANRERR